MKKKAQLGTYLDEDVYDFLVDHSENTGISITRIVEDALRAYLKYPRPRKQVVKPKKGRKKNVEA